MELSLEERFLHAATWGDEISVLEILKENPGLNVNCTDKHGTTALHWACFNGLEEAVSVLLAHPDIDVNVMGDSHSRRFMRQSIRAPPVFE